MSDTDDTDLLLLIPPDFFLVHSPDISDLDSDCGLNAEFEHREIKDSVVSDLISHVNDLESRICMIENFERSATQCSCHEDSFVNQSINSLTESDIFRPQIFVKKEELGLALTLGNINSDNFGRDKNCTGDHMSFPDQYHIKLPQVSQTGNSNNCQQNIKPELQFHLRARSNQETLLNEIDSFLEVKQKLLENNPTNLCKIIEPITTQRTVHSYLSEGCCVGQNALVQDSENSLALPEVYQLLKQMEDTQSEIEKKLKKREFQLQSNIQDVNNGIPTSMATENGSKTQGLDVDYLYTTSTKPVNSKETDHVLERPYQLEGNKHQKRDVFRPTCSVNNQVNPLFTPALSYSNEEGAISIQTDSKHNSVNPVQTSLNLGLGCRPLDSPIRVGKDIYNLEDGSQSKRGSFRRHLNFDRSSTGISIRQTNQKNYEKEESPRCSTESDQNKANDTSNIGFSVKRNPSGRSPNLLRKFNSLANGLQRAGSDKVGQNTGSTIDRKPSSTETLKQKISSNNLLSLSELWNKEPTFYSDDPNKLRQKLEEEKYRRQHCEQQIQELQLKVLEDQEKLAVAIKVDQEKDKAILQITESWKKLNDHWKELEEQRHKLAQELHHEQESSKTKTADLTKKVERWEKEVSQALDLAADYKEKCDCIQGQMDSIRHEMEEKIGDAQKNLTSLSEDNNKIKQENQQLLRELRSLKDRIQEEEDLLSKLKDELEKTNNKCAEFEAEVNVLKEQKETLTIKIKDERNRSSMLEQQQNGLQQAANEANKREKAAKEEVRLSNERIEIARTELRALYQGQLETVVKEKLQEFQSQLEAAEATLRAELHSKEKLWAEKASEQCRQLQGKHKLEILSIEERHREDANKWKSRLLESERLRGVTESRLQEETNRRADIAQRLHSVMETQWREALNIISNPLLNVYDGPKEENKSGWPSNANSSEILKGAGDPKPMVSRSNSASSIAHNEDAPFFKDGIVTYRTSQPQGPDRQLKQYIQMLLERGPGNLTPYNETLHDSLDQSFCPDTSDIAAGHRFMMDNMKKSAGQMDRLGIGAKPPWK